MKSYRNGSAISTLTLLLVGSIPGLATETPAGSDGVIATVNGEQVSLDAVERSLDRTHSSQGISPTAQADLNQLIYRVVNDVLIAQEARAMGLDQEPPIPETVAQFRRQQALKKLEWEEIWQHSEPSEEEVGRMFEDQYRRATFRVMTAYEKEDAEEMLKDLEEGTDFLDMVAERSVDPYRVREGLVDQIARVDLQREVGDLVFSLQPGDIGGPVQTDLGWSVVRLENRENADPERFEPLESTVTAIVRQEKARNRRKEIALTLISRYKIEVDQEVISTIEPQRRPDGRLLPTDPNPTAVVARVGSDHIITAQDYADALVARWKGVRNEDAARATAPIVLDRLIQSELLEAEALDRGYDRSPDVEQAALAYENELLLNKYLEEVVVAGVTVSEEEMNTYYDDNRQGFNRPPKVRLGQITVASEDEAIEVAEMLRQGTDLAWLARQRSLDRLSQDGGDRGWYVPQPGIPDFNAELFTAQIGDVLTPTGEGDNWVVTQVLDREEQGIYSFAEMSGNLRQAVYNQKLLESIDGLIKTLRERSEIEIREDALAALRITGTDEGLVSTPAGGGHGH